MATYKSEFLSHYYKRKLRPRTAYVFGWIYWWSRIASKMPALFNFLMHAPVISAITKAIAGIAPQRTMPRFARKTFKKWFAERSHKPSTAREQVILWADTFNNYFLPETLVAGVEVLEAAGFEVRVIRRSLCCGRPLYDFGMLKTAKKMLINIMHSLRDPIKNGVPIVGLEPSCVAVFRDELHNLFPHDQQASRLAAQVFTLGEFLETNAPHFTLPEINGSAIVHGHCHHRSVMGMDNEKKILKKTKLDFNVLQTTCCGMAGYFGYEKGAHYEVSIKCGEQLLLPTVRSADLNTVIIADGFSCREMIEQETGRKGLHLAQVLQMGLREDRRLPATAPAMKSKLSYNKWIAIAAVAMFAAGCYFIKRKKIV
jgi:Fe-S oxidoreductase